MASPVALSFLFLFLFCPRALLSSLLYVNVPPPPPPSRPSHPSHYFEGHHVGYCSTIIKQSGRFSLHHAVASNSLRLPAVSGGHATPTAPPSSTSTSSSCSSPHSRLHAEQGKNPYRQVIFSPHDPKLHLFDSHHPEDTAQFQLIARKMRMSRAFSPCGQQVAVTILQVLPATIVSFKAYGYCEVSYGKLLGQKKFISRPTLSQLQHYVGASHSKLRTIKLRPPHLYVPGQMLDARCLVGCRAVWIQGISKDKGFCGVVKRHGFKGGPATHGSRSHREGGTIGDSGRQSVLPGMKMAGHVGNKKVTEFGKDVIGVNPSTNQVLIKGCVVGKKRSEVLITRFEVEESNKKPHPVRKTNDNIFVQIGESPNMVDEEKRVQQIKQSYTDMDLHDLAIG
eukprot:GHVS01090835.1.p1 GENE.GHVS01090835.1~~GHVS01090835.1.p1  ORF type:complete len:395 (+),score=53.06 GHVS01090835.1:339-1523(+)